MKSLLIVALILLPLFLWAANYEVSLRRDGRLYNIVGTNYYLYIPLCLELGMFTAVYNPLFGTVKTSRQTYYMVKSYEKVLLPPGSITEYKMWISEVYVPVSLQ